MLEALAAHMDEPAAQVWQAKGRKLTDRSGDRRTQTRRRKRLYYIGAIIVLTDGDGTEYLCQITHQTPDGKWYCEPE